MNVVIPLAGNGQRFKDAGYDDPKPVIQVGGKTILEWSLSSLGFLNKTDTVIFIVQKLLGTPIIPIVLNEIDPRAGWGIYSIDKPTEGAACTVLEGIEKSGIDLKEDLLIMNGDQWFSPSATQLIDRTTDGTILTFRSDGNPKWSYAQVGPTGRVTKVAEKEVISKLATVGAYHFRKTRDFVNAANQMMEKNIRTNNEFYVCPVFNELIGMGKIIAHNQVEEMFGLGTPEDLKLFKTRKSKVLA